MTQGQSAQQQGGQQADAQQCAQSLPEPNRIAFDQRQIATPTKIERASSLKCTQQFDHIAKARIAVWLDRSQDRFEAKPVAGWLSRLEKANLAYCKKPGSRSYRITWLKLWRRGWAQVRWLNTLKSHLNC